MPIDLTKFHQDQLELPLSFRQLQEEHKVWSKYNFDAQHPDPVEFWKPIFGIMEELGELCHALLKKSQGIRGSDAQHDAKAKDVVADITVFLASTCSALGIDWQEVIELEWPKVRARDYKKDAALKVATPVEVSREVNINGDVFTIAGNSLSYDQIIQFIHPLARPETAWSVKATIKNANKTEVASTIIHPGEIIEDIHADVKLDIHVVAVERRFL